MKTKTIARNRAKLIDSILAAATGCRVYALEDFFLARPCLPEHAGRALRDGLRARLTYDADADKYTVHVHGNLWYEFCSPVRP